MLMRTRACRRVIVVASIALLGWSCEMIARKARTAEYDDLVKLFTEWREFQKPQMTNWVPDYTPPAMRQQKGQLSKYQSRLAAMDVSGWRIAEQVDYHLVRAEMNGLQFDHQVLRPWSRDPSFYAVLHVSETDVPAREGSVMYGVLDLWTYQMPLTESRLAELRFRLRAIPRILDQARENLVEEARDLWFLGVRIKTNESRALGELAKRAAEHHPAMVSDIERAKVAVDDFSAWLDQKQSTMTKPSGIGIENYNWHLTNVQLVPYTWQDQLVIVQRELDRSWSYLKLLENRNRKLPKLEMVATEEEYRRRYREAVNEFIAFLDREEVCAVPDYAKPALEAREGRFRLPTGPREFFTEVNYRDLRPMRAHGTHWFDLARMQHHPHSSPIRRIPLLYNIWASRAEGLATGMEEMMMQAGFLDGHPRARELIYVLLAERAARAMGDLKMHSNDFTLEQAVRFAVDWTPYGWLSLEGNTIWGEQGLYLNRPSYGTSYVVGKVHIDKVLADRAQQLAGEFTLRGFMDAFHGAGMIPVSLIRWEMTGLEDEIRTLW